MVSSTACSRRGQRLMGRLRRRDGATRTKTDAAACWLSRGAASLVFYIIICVITYEAIKQISLPISFCLVLLYILIPFFLRWQLFFLKFNLLFAPLLSCSSSSSPVTPDKVSISACWLSHCRLYACLTLTGTLGTGDTHHTMPITLPHFPSERADVCMCVCVRGDEGVKCLLHWGSGLSYTGENSLVPKEQKIAMLLFLSPH